MICRWKGIIEETIGQLKASGKKESIAYFPVQVCSNFCLCMHMFPRTSRLPRSFFNSPVHWVHRLQLMHKWIQGRSAHRGVDKKMRYVQWGSNLSTVSGEEKCGSGAAGCCRIWPCDVAEGGEWGKQGNGGRIDGKQGLRVMQNRALKMSSFCAPFFCFSTNEQNLSREALGPTFMGEIKFHRYWGEWPDNQNQCFPHVVAFSRPGVCTKAGKNITNEDNFW